MLRALCSLLVALCACAASAQPALWGADLPLRATRNGALVAPADIKVLEISPSGFIYVGGKFDAIDGIPARKVARLRPDGWLDPGWLPSILPYDGVPEAAAEDAAGNVALSLSFEAPASGVSSALVYVPAGARTATIVELERDADLVHTALAFAPDGRLYAGVCARPGPSPKAAEVRRYLGNSARDLDFLVRLPVFDEFMEVGRYPSSPRITKLAVHRGQVYVLGKTGRGLPRADAQTGSIDAAWRPIPELYSTMWAYTSAIVNDIAFSSDGSQAYLAGTWENDPPTINTMPAPPMVLARYSTWGSGARDKSWMPVVGTPGAIALDPSGDWLYAGSASLNSPTLLSSRITAVSTRTAAVLESWSPEGVEGVSYAWLTHLRSMPDRLLAAGMFGFIHGPDFASVFAVPHAGEPVRWPVLSVDTDILDLGSSLRPERRSRSLTIRNAGSGELYVQPPSLVVFGDGGDLSLQHDCVTLLAPGQACTVTVSATLPSSGGRVQVISTGGPPREIPIVSGPGAGRAFEFRSATGARFTSIAMSGLLGSQLTKRVVLHNLSDKPMRVDGIDIVDWGPAPVPGFSVDPSCIGSLPAHGSCAFDIRYDRMYPSSGFIFVSADVSGSLTWVTAQVLSPESDSDGDGIPNAVEYELGLDPLSRDNRVFLSSRLFVMQQYRDLLGREGDAPGVAYWTAALEDGAVSRAQLAMLFLASPEVPAWATATAEDFVRSVYLRMLRRPPDAGGLRAWSDFIGSAGAQDLRPAFLQQVLDCPEYRQRFGVFSPPYQ